MRNKFDRDEFTATNMRIALNEKSPELTFGAIPVIDQYELLQAYLAIDDGALAEAPQALDAYVSHRRRCTEQGVRTMRGEDNVWTD